MCVCLLCGGRCFILKKHTLSTKICHARDPACRDRAKNKMSAGTSLCVGFSLPLCGVCLLFAGAVGSFSNKPLSPKTEIKANRGCNCKIYTPAGRRGGRRPRSVRYRTVHARALPPLSPGEHGGTLGLKVVPCRPRSLKVSKVCPGTLLRLRTPISLKVTKAYALQMWVTDVSLERRRVL